MDTEALLKFLTHPLGAALALSLLLLVIYFVSVSICEIHYMIRFFILTFLTAAGLFYVNNYYLVNNFKSEPIIKESFDEFAPVNINASED